MKSVELGGYQNYVCTNKRWLTLTKLPSLGKNRSLDVGFRNSGVFKAV
jgi:hypothetical protein